MVVSVSVMLSANLLGEWQDSKSGNSLPKLWREKIITTCQSLFDHSLEAIANLPYI